MKEILTRFGEAIRSAGAAKAPLCIRAGGTKDFYGQSSTGARLDPRPYTGIVAYEPSELVVTTRCGTRLHELEATLRAHGQMLAFEPPNFGDAATVGGMVAAGLAGPRRQAAGAVRDHVLGVRVMDGNSDVLSFGGQVMKNVAGYDVSRLMVGSLGTLGLILEASIKVLPLPTSEATLQFEMPEDRAIELVNKWAAKPLPISATAWHGGDLGVRLSGAAAAVRAARTQLGGDLVDPPQADRFWRAMREQTIPFFIGTVPIWRVSVPSNARPLQLPGEQVIEWGGALRWLATEADAKAVREAAARTGGHATLYRGGDRSAGVFTPLAAPLERIHRSLKASFDPHGIFNLGRVYPGW